VQPPCPGRQVYSCVGLRYLLLDKHPKTSKPYRKVDEVCLKKYA
jgi:hypothetical protein